LWVVSVGAASAQGTVDDAARSGARPIEIASTPRFVVTHDPIMPVDAAYPATQGLRILLLDIQHDAANEEPAVYTREILQAAGFAGVATASQVMAEFDPAYQRFEVNHVRVIRRGAAEDRRDRAHLDFLRREEALEQQMLTGALTATLRLDDVRVGDVVDVAYTIYGAQPALDGRDARSFMLALPMPIERFALRSRWPAQARWAVHGRGPNVQETRERGSLLLEVAPQPVDSTELEEYAPAWAPMIPYLEAASFEDWADVADWGRALFMVTRDPDVTAIAERIAAEHPGKAEQVVAALRFVQQEVRYQAVVLGVGGYVPAAPGATLRSRAGECKAKSLLFLTLLDALDIDATAALVNTAVGPALPDYAPSPTAFDHVIASVTLDGKSYWLDPTSVFQGGTLDTLTQPYFGYALPLDKRSSELVAMTRRDLTEPEIAIHETYDLTGGASQPVRVHVEVVSKRAAADYQRALFGIYAKSKLEEGIVERYKARYGEAALAGESLYDDDLENNVFRNIYDITLEEPFTTGSDDARRRWFKAVAYLISGPVLASRSDERAWPAGVIGPAHQRHEIVLELPEIVGGWSLPTQDDTIENAAFRFHRRAELSGSTYSATFDLETLAEAIEPDILDAVIEDQERMLELRKESIWIAAGARKPLPDLQFPPLEIDTAPDGP
jgi:transglutaminase-like putative cysteine protease